MSKVSSCHALWLLSLIGCVVDGAVNTSSAVHPSLTEEGTSDGVYPESAWVAPSLLVDANFPGGVLSFATAQQFIDFYRAYDTANGSEGGDNGSTGTQLYGASATASATTNYATFNIGVFAGQHLEIGTCGIQGASFSGDTYLRVFQNGVEIASNDDACNGLGSLISFDAPFEASYEIRMGCFSSTTCSGTVGYSVLTPDNRRFLGGARTFSAVNTANATTGASTIVLAMSQGQVLDIGTCGTPGAIVNGDSYLRIFDVEAGGATEVASNDDACNGLGSRITYTVPRTGEYEVGVGCFGNNTCSGTLTYALSAELPASAMLPAGFHSAATLLDARPQDPADDAIRDVDYGEYVLDLKDTLTEDDSLRQLVDTELQIVVEGKLYQLTNMGVFQVDLASLAAYRAWLTANQLAIDTDPSFVSIPGEVQIDTNKYQVMPGVIRMIGGWGTPTGKLLSEDEDGTSTLTGEPSRSVVARTADGAGGDHEDEATKPAQPTGPLSILGCTPASPPPNLTFDNYTIGANFSRSESVGLGNRRFTLKGRSPGFDLGVVGFRTIYTKAKLQRKRRFLGITYWSTSYADDMILGVENMKLETDYVVPTPPLYNTLVKPQFNKLAKFKLGNQWLDVASFSINATSAIPPITQVDLANFANNVFNQLAGNVFVNVWKQIETDILTAIDPSYVSRYERYTKMVDAINNENKVRWGIGEGRKIGCDKHKLNWTFNTNGGFRFVKKGPVQPTGTPPAPPAPVVYRYNMKAGSFYGIVRVGGSWAGIRMVRQ